MGHRTWPSTLLLCAERCSCEMNIVGKRVFINACHFTSHLMKGGILIVDGCSNLTSFLAIGKCQQIMLKTPFNYKQKPALKKCLETACYLQHFTTFLLMKSLVESYNSMYKVMSISTS